MTGDDVAATASALRDEALGLVAETGLGDILTARFGSCNIVGSVDLDLMSWRDIDIYVQADRANALQFIETLAPLHAAFAACGHTIYRMRFNDEWARPRGSYGSGYYWGLRVATSAGADWKLDLWGWDRETQARKLAEHDALKQALAGADRNLILSLKTQAQRLPGFRDAITSHDIYRFVLTGAGETLDQLGVFSAERRKHGQ